MVVRVDLLAACAKAGVAADDDGHSRCSLAAYSSACCRWLGESSRRFTSPRSRRRSVAAWVYLLIFGSLIAFTAFVYLLRVSTPARVATYAYVNPVVAVILGWLMAGEAISARMLVAAVIIIAGVALITAAEGRSAEAAELETTGHEPRRSRPTAHRRLSDRGQRLTIASKIR